MVEVELSVVAARLAALRDGVALGGHDQLRLGVVALGAQHELADEPARHTTPHITTAPLRYVSIYTYSFIVLPRLRLRLC